MTLLDLVEERALAVSSLTVAIGVIAALFSALSAWSSAREARRAHQALDDAQRLRLASEISGARAQQLSEIRRAQALVKELLVQSFIEALAKDQLAAPAHLDKNRRLREQERCLEHDAAQIKALLTPEGDNELDNMTYRQLERMIRQQRIELQEASRIADALLREADRLHAEQWRDHRPIVR